MRFRQIAILSRCLCARTVTAALASAFMLGTLCQSQAADPEPKRVLMLQSFGLASSHGPISRNFFGLK
jgi:hypothetical protein